MLKTVIFFIFVLTSSFFTSKTAHGNLIGQDWYFHHEGQQFQFKRVGSDRGHALVDLKEVLKKFPTLLLEQNNEATDFVLKNKTSLKEARFSTRHSYVIHSWGKIELSTPVKVEGKKILIPLDFGDRALRPVLTSTPPITEDYTKYEGKVIDVLIDPGHGGNDQGAKSENGVLEKDLVLIMAQLLHESLRQKGVSSALTRSQDIFLTLPERTKLANRLKAKLFLSLHFNHDPSKTVRGFEIFVMSLKPNEEGHRQTIQLENQVIPHEELDAVNKSLSFIKAEANLEDSLKWAKSFRDSMKKFVPELRTGVKMAPFYVLWGAEMPSLLLELGYINSSKDMEFYQDSKSRVALVNELSSMMATQLKENKK